MRKESFVAGCAAGILLLSACGGEEEAEVPEVAAGSEPAAVTLEAEAPVPGVLAASHGGTVVVTGDHQVEVLANDDGYVDAYVVSPGAPPPSQARITVQVPADDGGVHPVMLTWDPAEGRYRGRLHRVRPIPGPVEVVLVVGRDEYRGRAPRVVVIGPSMPSGPRVVVRGEPAPDDQVEYVDGVEVVEPADPRVQVVVQRPEPPRPRVEVHVQRPAPPPVVVVHQPAPPPGPRVVVHRPGAPVVHVREPAPRVRVHTDNGLHRGHTKRVEVRGPGRGHGGGHGGRVRVRAR